MPRQLENQCLPLWTVIFPFSISGTWSVIDSAKELSTSITSSTSSSPNVLLQHSTVQTKEKKFTNQSQSSYWAWSCKPCLFASSKWAYQLAQLLWQFVAATAVCTALLHKKLKSLRQKCYMKWIYINIQPFKLIQHLTLIRTEQLLFSLQSYETNSCKVWQMVAIGHENEYGMKGKLCVLFVCPVIYYAVLSETKISRHSSQGERKTLLLWVPSGVGVFLFPWEECLEI